MAQSSHIVIGRLGELIAAKYLGSLGFTVVERNYRRPWGELDLVVEKDNVLHFVEVKSTARARPEREGADVHRPEDHLHTVKRQRLVRAIGTYLTEKRVRITYTADLVVVYVDPNTRCAIVDVLWDVAL